MPPARRVPSPLWSLAHRALADAPRGQPLPRRSGRAEPGALRPRDPAVRERAAARAIAAAPAAVRGVGLNPERPLSGNLNWLLGVRPRAVDHRPATACRQPAGALPRDVADRAGAAARRLWPLGTGAGVRTVVNLFDLIPLVFEEHYLRDPVWRASGAPRARRARRRSWRCPRRPRTMPSGCWASTARLTVIDAGVSSRFAEAYERPSPRCRASATLPRAQPGFMLYVSGIEFRKNNERLIEAMGARPPASCRVINWSSRAACYRRPRGACCECGVARRRRRAAGDPGYVATPSSRRCTGPASCSCSPRSTRVRGSRCSRRWPVARPSWPAASHDAGDPGRGRRTFDP